VQGEVDPYTEPVEVLLQNDMLFVVILSEAKDLFFKCRGELRSPAWARLIPPPSIPPTRRGKLKMSFPRMRESRVF